MMSLLLKILSLRIFGGNGTWECLTAKEMGKDICFLAAYNFKIPLTCNTFQNRCEQRPIIEVQSN